MDKTWRENVQGLRIETRERERENVQGLRIETIERERENRAR